ncbi:MAG: sulfatase-like hydrolase/transferase [Chloroflexota bacterium]
MSVRLGGVGARGARPSAVRRACVALAALVLVAALPGVMPVAAREAGARPAGAPAKPDIVVIMVDDLPETGTVLLERLPAIRSLFLEEGIRFTDYHANDPLCCPGRAAFLTGLTTDHHGVARNDIRLLDARVTLATELRAKGYTTILTGKYLNGASEPALGRIPGWSRFAYTGNGYYRYEEILSDGTRLRRGQAPRDYQPDVAFARAQAFLRRAPADTPVFLWVNPFSPHSGNDPYGPQPWPRWSLPAIAPRFRDDPRCADLPPWRTAAHTAPDTGRPAYLAATPDRFREGYDLVTVCRSLLAVDAGIAALADTLAAQGRLANTILVLTADNGMGWGAFGWYPKRVPFATGMPLLIRWPAGRGTAPAVDRSALANVDLAPTLCHAAGCAMGPFPGGRPRADGTSFLPLLLGTGRVVRTALYAQHREARTGIPFWWSLRTTADHPAGRWRYTEYAGGERELYDLSGGSCDAWRPGDPGDPCELVNRIGDPSLASLVRELHLLLGRARATGGAAPEVRGTIGPTAPARRR